MKLHRATIKLNSPIITPIKGDTLWGHIVWGIANHEGDEAVAKFLEQQKISPNFIISSAFPKGTICKPLYKPKSYSEDLTVEDYVNIKKAKKEKYVNFQSLTSSSQNKAFKHTFTMHNTIDRNTNSVLESGLYSTEEMWGEENEFDIYIRTDFENKRILELLNWAFENGFGKDASTGKGNIKILKSELLTEKTHTGQYVALAPFAFNSPKKLNHLRAEIFVREGKIGGAFATYLNPFKKNILLFDEGTVLESETELKFIGELLTDIHADKRICNSGFAPVLPI
ncbi:CRISPR-associated RAMP protein, Csm4 [Fibrobacteria bacterium R8-3-H12]